MDIRIDSEGPMRVAYLSGESHNEDAECLKEALDELVSGRGAGVAVDLSGLKTVNSSGLSALIHLVTRSRLAGGQVVLVNPSPFVKEVLEITRLNRLFDVCANHEEAKRRLGNP